MPKHEYEWQVIMDFRTGNMQIIRSERLYVYSEKRANWYLDGQGEWVRLPDSDERATFISVPDDADLPTLTGA